MRPSANPWRVYVGVWGLAALPRLIYLALARPPFDNSEYWLLSSGLLHDGSLAVNGVKTVAFEPMYPLFLAASRLLVGDRAVLVQGLQAVVASAGAIYLYRLACALTHKSRIGSMAAMLFATYPLLVRHAVTATDTALLTTMLIAFTCAFVLAKTVAHAAIAGMWLGLAILTRTVALPLLLLTPSLLGWRRTRAALAMIGATLVVLTPYGARNYALSGAVLPARSGVNLFLSNCEYASGIMASYGPDILSDYGEAMIARAGLERLGDTPAAEQQEDAAYRRLALAEMKRHPLDTLWLKIRNVFYFFSPALVPSHEITPATRIQLGERGTSAVENSSPRPLIHRVVYSMSYGTVLLLASFGVYHRRRDLGRDGILWSTLLTFTAVYAVFFPATQYRVPVEFVLLFYAVVGLDSWISVSGEGR